MTRFEIATGLLLAGLMATACGSAPAPTLTLAPSAAPPSVAPVTTAPTATPLVATPAPITAPPATAAPGTAAPTAIPSPSPSSAPATPRPTRTPAPTDTPTPTPVATLSPTDSPSPAAEQLVIGKSAGDRPFLLDPRGFTLYVFDNDAPGQSTCDGECADAWPPLTVKAGTQIVADGFENGFATTERSDGSLQVTYDGAPLYGYAGDNAAGDTNGEGIGEVWHLARARFLPLP